MPTNAGNVWKGCIAGMVGGLLGSFLMSKANAVAQQMVSAPPPKGEDSTVRTASTVSRLILHKELTPQEKKEAGPIVHYAFGTSVAAAYGAAAELVPIVSAGWGSLFGMAVWLGAHVIAVPALGLSEPVTRSSLDQETAEFAAHIAYGATVEVVRRSLRKL